MKEDSILDRVIADIESRFRGLVKPAYIRKEEVGEPEPGPPIDDLDLPYLLKETLKARGIRRLYRFQWEAIKSILDGENTVIVSGTGTGKTEAFLIPLIIHGLSSRQKPSSLLLYPTKALARDQLKRINEIIGFGGVSATIYDGDTPAKVRRRIASNPPHILISNPDMIHLGLVLSSAIRNMVKAIEYLVLDEMHVYEGVLGAHVRAIIERLRRFHGGSPVFIGSSATIGNPEHHGELLFGEKVRVVRGPIRRRGLAYHILLSIGFLSRWTVASILASVLASNGLKVLVFVDSQQMAEVLARSIRRSGAYRFMVHRAGLSREERRRVEELLSRGEIDGVVATPTLELGIDIGYLDAVILASPPPSYGKYLQRAGRAGRRERVGYIFMLLGDDPIDAYYERDPEEYFRQEIPPLYIEPSNEEVLRLHALALLLQQGYIRYDSVPDKHWLNALEKLVGEGLVRKYRRGFYPLWRRAREEFLRYPSIRGAGPQVAIIDRASEKVIGYRELPMAILDLHPDAIYLHSGRVYRSIAIDVEGRRAYVERMPDDLPLYTRPLYTTDLVDYEVLDKRLSSRGIPLAYTRATISIIVEGFMVYNIFDSSKPLSKEMLEKPVVYTYTTRALILKYPYNGEWDIMGNAEAFHAIEHTLISAARPVCGAALGDLGGISYPSGDIVVYDSTPGGSGLSRLLYERFERAEEIAYSIINSCRCEDGCPRCIYSPYCGNNNKILSRRKALYILHDVLRKKTVVSEEPAETRFGNPIA